MKLDADLGDKLVLWASVAGWIFIIYLTVKGF